MQGHEIDLTEDNFKPVDDLIAKAWEGREQEREQLLIAVHSELDD